MMHVIEIHVNLMRLNLRHFKLKSLFHRIVILRHLYFQQSYVSSSSPS